jgi:hypothetical protein
LISSITRLIVARLFRAISCSLDNVIVGIGAPDFTKEAQEGGLVRLGKLLKGLLKQVALLLAETYAGPGENSRVSEQVLNIADSSRFRYLFAFLLSHWLFENLLGFLYVVV